MAMTNHLSRREATYYWRCRLPRSIALILGRSHLARSLRTKAPDRARRLARRLSVVVEEVGQSLKDATMKGRKPPTSEDLDRILMDLFTEVLETGEVKRAARPSGYSPWTIDGDASEEEQDLQEAETDPDIGWNWRTHLKHNLLDPIMPAIEAMLVERNLAPLDDEREWRLFLRKAMATVGAALEIESEREQGIYHAPIHPFVSVKGAAAVGVGGLAAEVARQKVSDIFDANIAAKKKENKWKPESGTEKQARIALRLFVAFKGDLPFAQVQPADAWAFREWLCGLPSLVGKSIYDSMHYQAAIDLREAIATDLAAKPTRHAGLDAMANQIKADIQRQAAALKVESANEEWERAHAERLLLQRERKVAAASQAGIAAVAAGEIVGTMEDPTTSRRDFRWRANVPPERRNAFLAVIRPAFNEVWELVRRLLALALDAPQKQRVR